MADEETGLNPAEDEIGEPSPPETKVESTEDKPVDGFQKRISELTRKRREAERDAAYWRGRAESVKPEAPTSKPTPKEELNPDDFNSDSDYLKAVAQQTREEIRAELEADRRREVESRTKEAVAQIITASRTKYADFDEVALDPKVPVSDHMYQAALGENLGDILYHLGKNSAEAARIASLPPLQQAKEIGKIEIRLNSTPKKTTNAPPPPPKVGTAGVPPKKSEGEMSRAELHAKWEAERRKGLGV